MESDNKLSLKEMAKLLKEKPDTSWLDKIKPKEPIKKINPKELAERFNQMAENMKNYDMSWLNDPAPDVNLETELKRYFGYDSFRDGQREIVEALVNREDILASCPTAFGKSICYQLPALIHPGLSIVVSPLISLMKDQVDNLLKKGIKSGGFINSTQTEKERQHEMKRIANNETKILYISPEKLASRWFTSLLAEKEIGLLIIDEAHCISQWGHDFRPDYLNIFKAKLKLSPKATGLFTATATKEVKKDILHQIGLHEEDTKIIEHSVERNNLKNTVIQVDSESHKYDALTELVENISGKGIIYAGTRKKVEEVAHYLKSLEINSDYYHAGRPENERLNIQDSFFSDSGIQIIVATNAFGMGIDKEDIRFVIHWDMPGTLENYTQESGRAGRDGKDSICVLIYNTGDEKLHKWFAEERSPNNDTLVHTYKEIYNSKSVDGCRIININTLEDATELPMDKIKIILTNLNKYGLIHLHQNMPSILNIQVKTKEKDKTLTILARQDDHQLEELCEELNISAVKLYSYLTEQKEEGNINFSGKEDSLIIEIRNHTKNYAKSIELFTKHKTEYNEQCNKINNHIEYIQTEECRTKVIKKYFGETHTKNCGNCDNCNKHLQNIDSEMLFASTWLWAIDDNMKAKPQPVGGAYYEEPEENTYIDEDICPF